MSVRIDKLCKGNNFAIVYESKLDGWCWYYNSLYGYFGSELSICEFMPLQKCIDIIEGREGYERQRNDMFDSAYKIDGLDPFPEDFIIIDISEFYNDYPRE